MNQRVCNLTMLSKRAEDFIISISVIAKWVLKGLINIFHSIRITITECVRIGAQIIATRLKNECQRLKFVDLSGNMFGPMVCIILSDAHRAILLCMK